MGDIESACWADSSCLAYTVESGFRTDENGVRRRLGPESGLCMKKVYVAGATAENTDCYVKQRLPFANRGQGYPTPPDPNHRNLAKTGSVGMWLASKVFTQVEAAAGTNFAPPAAAGGQTVVGERGSGYGVVGTMYIQLSDLLASATHMPVSNKVDVTFTLTRTGDANADGNVLFLDGKVTVNNQGEARSASRAEVSAGCHTIEDAAKCCRSSDGRSAFAGQRCVPGRFMLGNGLTSCEPLVSVVVADQLASSKVCPARSATRSSSGRVTLEAGRLYKLEHVVSSIGTKDRTFGVTYTYSSEAGSLASPKWLPEGAAVMSADVACRQPPVPVISAATEGARHRREAHESEGSRDEDQHSKPHTGGEGLTADAPFGLSVCKAGQYLDIPAETRASTLCSDAGLAAAAVDLCTAASGQHVCEGVFRTTVAPASPVTGAALSRLQRFPEDAADMTWDAARAMAANANTSRGSRLPTAAEVREVLAGQPYDDARVKGKHVWIPVVGLSGGKDWIQIGDERAGMSHEQEYGRLDSNDLRAPRFTGYTLLAYGDPKKEAGTCDAFCEAHGLFCEAGWEATANQCAGKKNTTGTRVVAKCPGDLPGLQRRAGCSRPSSVQMCRCATTKPGMHPVVPIRSCISDTGAVPGAPGWFLATPGADSCPSGAAAVPKAKCVAAALQAGANIGRTGENDLLEGAWGHTPPGCFVHAKATRAEIKPHFSSGSGKHGQGKSPKNVYQVVCERVGADKTCQRAFSGNAAYATDASKRWHPSSEQQAAFELAVPANLTGVDIHAGASPDASARASCYRLPVCHCERVGGDASTSCACAAF